VVVASGAEGKRLHRGHLAPTAGRSSARKLLAMADPARLGSLPTWLGRLTRPAAGRPRPRKVVLGPAYLRPLTTSASIGKESPDVPCHSSSAAWTSATNPARAAGPAAPIRPASGDPAP
jgi:hypothetical protein